MKNKLICGDNLEILATIDAESVDLIYIDPPFFSNRHYELIWGDEAEIRSFEDRWEGGINVYVDWMRQRVIELHRVLKKTGSFYLHCDWHAGHYLKVMCDDIFGYGNFRNEIAWCYHKWSVSQRQFVRNHDMILFYAKSDANTFNTLFVPLTAGTLKRWKGYKQQAMFDTKGIRTATSLIDQSQGSPMPDWWEISVINPAAKERVGYPTQKPEQLLDRIIKVSSNQGDVVLDAFCGCGTAMVVAQLLKRRWIGIDISPSAIALVKNRLLKICDVEKTIDIVGMPTSVEELKTFKPFDFQYWVVNEMHGTPSSKKVGDMGIDGLSFYHHYPIQVKQSDSVGRNVVDNFETALRRYYKDKTKNFIGYIVAFSFTKGAHEEVSRAKKDGFKIELVTVQRLLDKKFSIAQEGELFAG